MINPWPGHGWPLALAGHDQPLAWPWLALVGLGQGRVPSGRAAIYIGFDLDLGAVWEASHIEPPRAPLRSLSPGKFWPAKSGRKKSGRENHGRKILAGEITARKTAAGNNLAGKILARTILARKNQAGESLARKNPARKLCPEKMLAQTSHGHPLPPMAGNDQPWSAKPRLG